MSLSRIALFIVVGAIVAGICTRSVVAQEPSRWSPDARVAGYLDDTYPPYLMADANHTVHALASQRAGDDGEYPAIVYRQWTLDGGWSPLNDILVSPDGEIAITGAYIDTAGMMHLVVFAAGQTLGSSLFYIRAPAAEAANAQAWSEPIQIGADATAPHSGAIVGDDNGNLVVIHNGTAVGNGVYTTHSSDGGETWSEETPIFLTYDTKMIAYGLNMTPAADGRIHAVWNLVSSKGVDQSLYYARLDIASGLWTEPTLLDERIDRDGYFGPSFPQIVDDGRLVTVMYNSGNPNEDGPVSAGRPVQLVRISEDGGATWRRPIQPFASQLGRSGEYALVLDSNNVTHAVFMQRIEQVVDEKVQIIDGPWHSEMRDGTWLPPKNFVAAVAPHDLHAVVVQGNVLLVVWRQDPGIGDDGIWYTYRVLESRQLPAVALPTIAPTATPISVATATLAPPTPTATAVPIWQADVRAKTGPDQVTSLAISVAPVLVVLAGVFVFRRLSAGRRR